MTIFWVEWELALALAFFVGLVEEWGFVVAEKEKRESLSIEVAPVDLLVEMLVVLAFVVAVSGGQEWELVEGGPVNSLVGGSYGLSTLPILSFDHQK